MLSPHRSRRSRETPVVTLVNIVFLLLIFFLLAGTVGRSIDSDVRLVRAETLGTFAPLDALVIHADGRLTFGGVPADPGSYAASLEDGEARILPDRDAPAARIVEVAEALRAASAERVVMLTEQALR
ncbi:biopolymer transporter ExbD [Roseitranquillus sediminis]|uniref:biopolymer transporter ExbD n=1 Tax=Roseitranquillus sediminis TaxID=2809051 RepID=UPI001D0C48AD|nr:biopolymer transporter ExbD [Roseitranquillus sediminis]MBM9594399.1 biopolymer transporter ExbD [Roseitranquillus sediminis]